MLSILMGDARVMVKQSKTARTLAQNEMVLKPCMGVPTMWQALVTIAVVEGGRRL